MISFDDFKKLDLRVARVLTAEEIEGTDKLLRLEIDLGDPLAGSGLGKRYIVSGIKENYKPEDLIGREIIVVANLEARLIKGVESNGMLLAAHDEEGLPVLLRPDKDVAPGSKIT